ncbi:MAG TPA: dTDP-glucose 4,6-dehydratase [Anaerolineae bacterium]|nr:dTDP-glucose 4,6-dehydratase [Anaerolineae bacterium]
MKNLLITGGAGFIGSNYVRYVLENHSNLNAIVFDKLTYAGNLDNLRDVNEKFRARYHFVQGDICDAESVAAAMRDHHIDTIVNFAAESHVDRSLLTPDAFVKTDVNGTYVLLEAAKIFQVERYHQVSTDEVYGDIPTGSSRETDLLNPRSPYSASKAGADLMVNAYHVSFGLPTTITRGSNTYGPYQYPEKLLPLFITNALEDQLLPIYGDGLQVRDWLYVLDHCSGIDLVLRRGTIGETYNLGGENEQHNIDVIRLLLKMMHKPEALLRRVTDRPGHDRRYSLDVSKLHALGFEQSATFEQELEATVKWYTENEWWWRKIKTGEYLEYYKQQYGRRLAESEKIN